MAATRFSTFNILSGGALDLTEKPARVVAAIPYEYYYAYALPGKVSYDDFCTMLSSSGIDGIKLFHVLPNVGVGIGIVGVQSSEELAILKKHTFCIRCQSLVTKRVIPFKDSLLDVSISPFEAASSEVNTKNIAQALRPFGDILDITFLYKGMTTDSCANVILDLANGKRLPEKLQVGKNMVDISCCKTAVYNGRY